MTFHTFSSGIELDTHGNQMTRNVNLEEIWNKFDVDVVNYNVPPNFPAVQIPTVCRFGECGLLTDGYKTENYHYFTWQLFLILGVTMRMLLRLFASHTPMILRKLSSRRWPD